MSKKMLLGLISLLLLIHLLAKGIEERREQRRSSINRIDQPSEHYVQNLYKLCKIWGLAKYKHPQITNGEIDWDEKLFDYIDLVGSPKFDSILFQMLPPIEKDLIRATAVTTQTWGNDGTLFSKEIQGYLDSLALIKLSETQQYVEPGTWDITPKFKENAYPDAQSNDKFKLLTIFRFWNIVEFYFPYKDIMDDNWDETLLSFIPKILQTKSQLDYKLTLLEFVCKINDGHGGIHNDSILENYFGENQIPIELKLIDSQAIVVRCLDEKLSQNKFVAGDEVIAIDGEAIKDLKIQKGKYIAASTEVAKRRILSEYLLRTTNASVVVLVNRNGRLVELNVPTINYNTAAYVQRDILAQSDISEGIAYIYPGSLNEGELDSLLGAYREKKAIIFDYRCYPSVNVQNRLPNFLLPYPTYAFQSTRYSRDLLGSFMFTAPYKWGKLNEDYYKGKFIILVNEYTQSQPEFEILIYSKAPNVTIIGSSTAGTVGNWTPIVLPGNLLTSMSGNGIYRTDKSHVQRIGIVPDVFVKQSLEDIKNNRDEAILMAIELSK